MEELIQAKKYARTCVAVHALFEMFCIRVDTAASTQNAGCTMAIHAECTMPKKHTPSTLLIYNDFLKNSYWHNQCTYHSMLAIQVQTELIDMSLIQEKFSSLFSNFDVTTQARPDGGILLTLNSSDGRVFKRSISYAQLHAGDQLSWVISAIRRDLAEQASELPQISMLQSQQRFALPTYHSR
nr:DUF3509 domain-containing protein [Pseudomonas fluorescens]